MSGSAWLALDATEEAAVIRSALAQADRLIAGSHRTLLTLEALPWAVQALDLHHEAEWAPRSWRGKVAGIEERWDLATWAASTTLTLARPETELDGACTADPLDPPARPSLPSDAPDTDLTFTLRMGGEASSPVYDQTWVGVMTNRTNVAPGSQIYPTEVRFTRPEAPAGARENLTVVATPDEAGTWAASTAVSVGAEIVADGHLYLCTDGGTTGASEPTWPTGGGTVADDGAVWQHQGWIDDGVEAVYRICLGAS
jgi:hypothetical protein